MVDANSQAVLIEALEDPARYPEPVESVSIIETHISWILLTGRCAYKIKKGVDLGFLDFSTLERREHFCREELRLNRRLAPELYLGVVALTGSPTHPVFDGPGRPIEWAVRMRQFDPGLRFDRLLAAGRLEACHFASLGRLLAEFHADCPIATGDRDHGRPERVRAAVNGNFEQSLPLAIGEEAARLEALRRWSLEQTRILEPLIEARRRSGRVRECHGDMHLANIALIEGRPVPFDALEFNEDLRWIDTISELAFLTMDLQRRGRPGMANLVRNVYLEHGGDYEGLPLSTYYEVYRALVRLKVAAIRRRQDPGAAESATDEITGYLELAEGLMARRRPFLAITHGLSGSGKSSVTERLLSRLPMLRIRADRERRRLFPDVTERYTVRANDATYGRLLDLARTALEADVSVVVDATFLNRRRRGAFRRLAAGLGLPFIILDMQAPIECLRRWIVERADEGSDPSEADLAVLERQLRDREPLTATERAEAIVVDTAHDIDFTALVAAIEARLRQRPEASLI